MRRGCPITQPFKVYRHDGSAKGVRQLRERAASFITQAPIDGKRSLYVRGVRAALCGKRLEDLALSFPAAVAGDKPIEEDAM